MSLFEICSTNPVELKTLKGAGRYMLGHSRQPYDRSVMAAVTGHSFAHKDFPGRPKSEALQQSQGEAEISKGWNASLESQHHAASVLIV